MFAGKNLLVALTVLASVNLCLGSDVSPDAQALFDKIFHETDKEPMSPSETIEALNNLKTMTDDKFIVATIRDYEPAYNGKLEKCDSQTLKELGLLFSNYQFGIKGEGEHLSSIATMVKSKWDDLLKTCNDQYEAKLTQAMNSKGAAQAEKAIDELLDSVDGNNVVLIPRIFFSTENVMRIHRGMAKYVQKKESVGSNSLLGPNVNPKKFEKAYEKVIKKPCKAFTAIFGEALAFGLGLESSLYPEKLERDERLLKKESICVHAGFESTMKDCMAES